MTPTEMWRNNAENINRPLPPTFSKDLNPDIAYADTRACRSPLHEGCKEGGGEVEQRTHALRHTAFANKLTPPRNKNYN